MKSLLLLLNTDVKFVYSDLLERWGFEVLSTCCCCCLVGWLRSSKPHVYVVAYLVEDVLTTSFYGRLLAFTLWKDVKRQFWDILERGKEKSASQLSTWTEWFSSCCVVWVTCGINSFTSCQKKVLLIVKTSDFQCWSRARSCLYLFGGRGARGGCHGACGCWLLHHLLAHLHSLALTACLGSHACSTLGHRWWRHLESVRFSRSHVMNIFTRQLTFKP